MDAKAGAHPIYCLREPTATAEHERIVQERDRYMRWHAIAEARAVDLERKIQVFEYGITRLIMFNDNLSDLTENKGVQIALRKVVADLDKLMEEADEYPGKGATGNP